jgi:diguanylate cyclase (GGDEF)-like protein
VTKTPTVDSATRLAFPQPKAQEARRQTDSANAPRLIIRFGMYLALGLAMAAGGIVLFLHQNGQARAEEDARDRATLLRDVAASFGLAGPLDQPLSGARRDRLDRFFLERMDDTRLLGASVFRMDGSRVYAVGSVTRRSEPAALVKNVLRTGVVSLTREASNARRMVVLTPLTPRGSTAGVLAIETNYEPVAEAAQEAFLPVAGVLVVVMVIVFLLFIPVLRRITGHVRLQMRLIQHQALHDDLTGLPNRMLFHDRIEEAIHVAKRSRQRFVVMIMDLDRFKEINDTLGHHAGDALLQEVASRLSEVLRDTDTVARLGGDEFGVLSADALDLPIAMAIAERIRKAVEQPLRLDGLDIDVECSIGIALFPVHGETVVDLLKHADFAMYGAKQRGTSFEVYAPTDKPITTEQIGLVAEFRRALDERQLAVHYQPAVELSSGRIRGVEALVRWRHPRHGLLLPGEFVPLIEQTSLINGLTLEVLDQALAQLRAWIDEGLDLRVAVNLTPRSLQDSTLPGHLERLLFKWDVQPAQLDIEITESTIMSHQKRALEALEALRTLGVGLVLDDFGTGYSSLTFLRGLPVQKIKIDKSFVEDMDTSVSDGVIVRSLVDLAHNLGLAVIAEGVENEAVLRRLDELGCDAAQGFHLSPPRTADELAQMLDERARVRPRAPRPHLVVLPRAV